jgi:spermidine/putrescine transport system substrate-binding protein
VNSRRPCLALIAVLLLTAPVASAAGDGVPELRLLNWSEYMDPQVLAQFEQRHGVAVREIYFESDEHRDRMIQDTEGEGYDIAVVNGPMVQTYARRGWIDPIDHTRAPNLRFLDPEWVSAYDAAPEYGVPLFWGTLGIIYRTDLVKRPLTSWMDLLRPDPGLKGRIVMMNSSRELLGVALKALGHSMNSVDPDELAAAESLLLAQRPYVKDYFYVALSEQSALVSGEAVASMIYNGDALMLKEHHPDLAYAVPAEGSLLWVDYLTVMARSDRKALAHAFIDFLNEPEIAAQLAEYLHYPSPNTEAERLLPEAHRADPVVHPPPEVMARLEPSRKLEPHGAKLRNEIFARIVQ